MNPPVGYGRTWIGVNSKFIDCEDILQQKHKQKHVYPSLTILIALYSTTIPLTTIIALLDATQGQALRRGSCNPRSPPQEYPAVFRGITRKASVRVNQILERYR
jgi:hypothetical protein